MSCPVSFTKRGFTLIELLIVIAIISILSVVGIVLFTGVQKGARDSKRRADIDAIAKAYEVKNSSGSYVAIGDSDFSSGKKPQDLSKGEYFNWLPTDGSGFKACASLDDNPNSVCNTPATNCYCKVSTQGTLNPSSPVNQGESTGEEFGLGGSSSQSCDPNGTLLSGLVGYWKMDEGSWNGTSGEVKDSSGNGNNGTIVNGTTTVAAKFGNGGNFNGVNQYINIPASLSTGSINTEMTISVWANLNTFTNGHFVRINAISTTGHFLGFYGNSAGPTQNPKYLSFEVRNSSNTGFYLNYNYSGLTSGPWHNYVATAKAGTFQRFYIDGTQVANLASPPATVSQASSILIGYQDWSVAPQGYINGQLDDIRVYNRALTDPEISNLYNSNNGCIP